MRSRLAALLFVPIALVLLLLGVLYAGTVTRAQQQEAFLDRARDANYLVISARQAILADDPDIVAVDLERYAEVYGVGTAVVDQAGEEFAAVDLDVADVPEREVAVAGRASEPRQSFWPWEVDRIVLAEPVFHGGDVVGALVTSSDASAVRRSMWNSWGLLLAAGAVLAMVAVVIADRTAGWVLRPVRAVDRAMTNMGGGRLDERIPPSAGPPELRQIIERFNDMAERVEHLMHRQQEFVANASHELRNPLNALMLRVEALALTVPSEHADDVEHVRAEALRMAQILDSLLLLADGVTLGSAQPVDLVDVAGRRVEARRAAGIGREIRVTAPDEEVWATVDPTALETAFDTVVDNAVKFAPAGTPLDVAVREGTDGPEIVVRDHGPGVPADELDHLTERFWRSPGHSAVTGSGLGLAIASELLAAGGGALRLELPDDGGLRARLQVRPWQEEAS